MGVACGSSCGAGAEGAAVVAGGGLMFLGWRPLGPRVVWEMTGWAAFSGL